MHDYTTDSLIAFLELSQEKGWMNKNTAQTKRNSIASIFDILRDDEKLDVRELDVDAILERFKSLAADNFTEASLKSYKSRLTSSIREFVRYKNDPFSYPVRMVNIVTPQRRPPLVIRPPKPVKKASKVSENSINAPTSHIFPIPIRENCTVRIAGLPQDLQASEAKKIAAVITALAMD